MHQTNLSGPDEHSRRRPKRADAVAAVSFEPRNTVRCAGEARFRSQAARDAACLFDVDPDVLDWSCLPPAFSNGSESFAVDLVVTRSSGLEYVAVSDGIGMPDAPDWACRAAADFGAVLRVVPHADILGHRLENARELLRYAKWRVSLSQRITLLAALDSEGTLTLIECMSAVRNCADPIGAVAALALRRFVEIDLDSGPLGPETRVIRFRG